MSDILSRSAANNLESLRSNPYPGRGIIVGTEKGGADMVQVYWLMGRSPSSRNRRLVVAGSAVRTELVDTSLPVDPLTLYAAMDEKGSHFVVTNGSQTDAIMNMTGEKFFERAMSEQTFEPDAPHYTSRISAMSGIGIEGGVLHRVSVISRTPAGECRRALTLHDDCYPGYGHGVHTYAGDGNPLPTALGDPLLLPLCGSIKEIAESYWDVLNPDNRVALVVKCIDIESARSRVHIINRF